MRPTIPAPLLEPESAARLLAAATAADAGLGTFTRLALVAGARRAELLAIRWLDLGWEAGSLLIACRDGAKIARARCTITLDSGSMNALAAWRSSPMAKAEGLGVRPDDNGYVFALEQTGFCWRADAVTRRMAQVAAQTGVSASISDLRRYSMGRLPALGIGLDVISHRLGLSAGAGMIPLFASAESLTAADREAARLLGRELDQALAALAPAALWNGQDG